MARCADTRTRRLRIAGAGATLVLLGALPGVAWAAGDVSNGRSTQSAATYSVTVAPGASQTVDWRRLGQVRLGSECSAEESSDGSKWGVGMKALTVFNNGPDPVAVAFEPNEFGPDGFVWLDAGESEAFFAVGEVHNEQTPEPGAGVNTFAILDVGGTSATGILGYAGRYDVATHTGTCTFSLQWEG